MQTSSIVFVVLIIVNIIVVNLFFECKKTNNYYPYFYACFGGIGTWLLGTYIFCRFLVKRYNIKFF